MDTVSTHQNTYLKLMIAQTMTNTNQAVSLNTQKNKINSILDAIKGAADFSGMKTAITAIANLN